MLTVRLLGGFEVQLNEARVEIPWRAAQALLAYLLLPPGKVHRRERLMGLLWPDAPQPNAQKNLRQALWLLGRALGPAGAGLLVADRLTIAADPRVLHELDVATLEEPLPSQPSVEALTARVAAYTGELLPGFYDEWVVVERERLQALFERLIDRLLKRLEAERRWPQVLEWGQRWIGLSHVPEPAYQAVMRAHAALGDPTSAMLAYERCRAALDDRLGLEPSPATRALYSQILASSGMAEPSAAVPESGAPPAGQGVATPAAAPAAPEAPYKGLNYFAESDAHLYFGRERLVALLLDYLRDHKFMAVVGASGSGKSSLVRAGLVPALRGATALPAGAAGVPGSGEWRLHMLTPGPSPLESLAACLAGDSSAAVAALAAELASNPRALHRFASTGPGRLLVVDQFEELFTLCRSEHARRAFIANLLYAAAPESEAPVRVVITLRADFYVHCGSHAELRAALESHQHYIGPMSAAELRRAIELPAHQAGLEFQSGLVDLILRDMGDEPGALPLLSHALLETWQRRQGGRLVLSGYAEAGGVRGAIARTAEHVYQELSPEYQALARRIFLRLTELGEGTEATRRRVRLAELGSEAGPGRPVEAVLHVLANARLITLSAEAVEVTHEALIREWPTLRQWLAEGSEGLRLHRRLTEAAQAWAALDHDPAELYRGGRLGQALEWAQAEPEALNALEWEFLEAAESQQTREAAERETQRQRELETAQRLAEVEKRRAAQAAESARQMQRRTRALRLMLLVALVFVVLAGVLFARERRAAVAAQANLARSEAQRLAAEADALFEAGGDAQLIALLAIRSLNTQYSLEADAVLGKALSLNYPTLSLEGHANSLRDAAYSPDGQYIVTAANDHSARLWRTDTGEEVRRLVGHTGAITGVAYATDGRWVLTGSEDGTACLWEAATGQQVRCLVGHGGQVQGVALSADGQWAATAATDNTVRVWSTATGEQASATLAVGSESVAFSPDGSQVLTGSDDGLGQIWNWQSGEVLVALEGHAGRVIEVAFSPDGRLALTGSVDKTARLWDTATGEQTAVLLGHTASVFGVGFSPDGSKVVTAGEDRNARLWDTATGRELGQFYGHSATVTDVAFAPDGEHFVTAGADNQALVWAVRPAGPVHLLAGHAGQIWNIAFSPDGRYVATASVDETARLWDVRTGQLLRTFAGHTAELWGLDYARDGRWLLTGSFDGTARLWEAATGGEIRQFAAENLPVIAGVAIAPDGRYVAASDEGGLAYIWETETGNLVRKLEAHNGGLNLMAYSPDGQVIATTSNDATAMLWSAATGERLHTLAGHTAFVTEVAFSPDGRFVATAGGDSIVVIWEVATGAQVRRITGHTELVWSVAYSPDGAYLATASADGTARLWEVETGREVRRFAGHTAGVQAVAVSPDGRLLATASDDGTARLWDIDFHATVQALCQRLLRDLTPEEREQHGIADNRPTCADH